MLIFKFYDFIESVSTVFSKYSTASGRACRNEYWWWQLFSFLIQCAAVLIDWSIGAEFSLFQFIAFLVLFSPSLTVTFRRYHDAGYSGWWILCPIINIIIPFFGSEPGENE